MERFEALNLIKRQLDTVIPTLEALEAKLKPEFEKKGWNIFDVGVNIVNTSLEGKLDYTVTVYSSKVNGGKRLSPFDISEVVMLAAPDYQGHVGVVLGAIPYPVYSVVNLQFLKDLQKI